MSRVIIVGCGIVGAAIAYELSKDPSLKITVLDKQEPALGATGAALGVLMGIISQKVKGKAWELRQSSMTRYETLIPELEAKTGHKIPFNRQGILMLCFASESVDNWSHLVATRHQQGYDLEIWDQEKIRDRCPHLKVENTIAGIYSPQDRQLDPTLLTLALVEAAKQNGVEFQFNVNVLDTTPKSLSTGDYVIKTTIGNLKCDWVVVAAGLGSTPLTSSLNESIDIRPVLGQALHLRLEKPLGNPDFQPVITGNDVHIVPYLNPSSPIQEYWLGATVEFPQNGGEILAAQDRLESVLQDAIAFCPELSEAKIIKTWSGLRPRPEGRPAPVIGQLPGHENILIATGHYRNGILLAPATAQAICDAIL